MYVCVSYIYMCIYNIYNIHYVTCNIYIYIYYILYIYTYTTICGYSTAGCLRVISSSLIDTNKPKKWIYSLPPNATSSFFGADLGSTISLQCRSPTTPIKGTCGTTGGWTTTPDCIGEGGGEGSCILFCMVRIFI